MGGNTFKLGDICRIELGKTPARSNKKFWDENKSSNNIWLSIADLPLSIKPVMMDSKEYITDEGAELCKVVPKNTLIVSFKLSLGRLAITGCDLYTNEAIAALYINENVELEQDYLYWYLTFFDWDAAAGSDIKVKGKTLNKAKLKELIVPIPSLVEQKRIVALLDTVFADLEQTRAKTEQNLKNARELFDSYLQQVFSQKGEGWEDKRLEEICKFSSGGTPSKKNEDYWDGDIPWVSGRDMKKTQLADSFLHISQLAVDEGAARLAPKGTILALVRGMGLAHGAQVAELLKPCAFNQDIKGIHPNPNVISRYLVFVLRQKINAGEGILSSAAHGTLKINMDALKNVIVPIPSTEKQHHIVSRLNTFIDDVNSLEAIYQKKLLSIDELKKSILQKAFSGELSHD